MLLVFTVLRSQMSHFFLYIHWFPVTAITFCYIVQLLVFRALHLSRFPLYVSNLSSYLFTVIVITFCRIMDLHCHSPSYIMIYLLHAYLSSHLFTIILVPLCRIVQLLVFTVLHHHIFPLYIRNLFLFFFFNLFAVNVITFCRKEKLLWDWQSSYFSAEKYIKYTIYIYIYIHAFWKFSNFRFLTTYKNAGFQMLLRMGWNDIQSYYILTITLLSKKRYLYLKENSLIYPGSQEPNSINI